MPSWWGKTSSKEDKKKPKEGIIDALQRKFKIALEEKNNGQSGGSWRCNSDTVSERGTRSRVPSRSPSPSPSTQVLRCQSFAERPHAQPLPLPGMRHTGIGRSNSGITASEIPRLDGGSKPLNLPLPRPGCIPNRLDNTYAEGDTATASVSSDSSTDSDYPSDSRILSPLTSDYENGNRTAINSPSSMKHKEQSPVISQKNSKETLKPDDFSLSCQIPSVSPRRVPLRNHVHNLQIPNRGQICTAPDSSMSSPSRSPIRAFGPEQVSNYGLWAGLGSGQCSSPGSGHNSGHNSVGGDMSGQLFWPNSRCSAECSPIPSPRMTSPGPSSRIQSGAVTPLHPRAGGATIESPTSRIDDGKHRSHPLPLPPVTISNTCPFSPAYSPATSPSLPRSPNRADNPVNPGSCWKKGRLLGRGTFGHVYLGFNSESGEMCAMKEVTLFSDDPKSKESAQQLGQEIAMLSCLRHPNIVQYYGSETVDDKLYIYLEYVSGGSIYKLLQEYGSFGEIIIRSYTHQILSGLVYLHAKNTVHRDIKGANILVDPSGRVKLVDFGMAKHITGQSCPLSFKGSPYWMAPEVVIRNSNGCNLAVDIWSLGCTVLEMATTKPPWSQFEGVAAIFKIGNSKELPAIPDNLSDDGKDFVRQCLQRDPSHRPTAYQLLEHPFVKNITPLEKPILSAGSSEAILAATNGGRSMVCGHARSVPGSDSGVAIHQSRGSKAGPGSSEAHSPKNTSCPVSPTESPLLQSRSSRHMSGRLSPSPISSPHTASGSSTPLTGGSGAIPFHYSMQSTTYLQESRGIIPRSQNILYTSSSDPYQEPMPDLFQGMSQPSHVFLDFISPDNGTPENQFGRPGFRDHGELYNGQHVLADRVSQQLLRDHVKLKPSLDLNPSLSMHGHTTGI